MKIRYCDQQSSAAPAKPCPHVALAGTSQCLEHREPGAPVEIPAPIPLTRRDWLLAEQPDRETRRLPPVPTLPAPGPWEETERMLVRLGQILDDADFAEAHHSVRPEIADAIHAAEEDLDLDAIVEMVQKPGGIIHIDRDLSDEEFAELRRRFEEACTDTRLRVLEPPCTECGTTDPCGLHCLDRAAADLHRDVVLAEAIDVPQPRRSIVGRIWQRLTRWTR